MTMLSPTAGYILDVCHGAEPGPLTENERNLLRSLASQVAEIAANPCQEQKRDLWYRHNRLERVRPLVLVFPEDSWEEVLTEQQLELTDPFWRQWEWYLKHLIYRHNRITDDFVVEPDLYVTKVVRGTGWGLQPGYISPGRSKGCWHYDPPLKDPNDLSKLTHPTIEVDDATTQRRHDATCEVFADVLPVHTHCSAPMANLVGEATALRGIDQFLIDMYDRPQWLHGLMDFIAEGVLKIAKSLADNGHLTLNNRNHYNDSGGIGYTTELPAPDFNMKHVRLRDLWGFGVAQELAWVGPDQHEEFVLNYQLRLLENFGLNAYGCCEEYTTKFDMLKRVPRLRRVSVSPWCDIEVAAEKLGDRLIFSWKPNPAMLVGNFDPGRIRAYVRRTLEAARNCVLEIILKDTFTLEHDPARVETWAAIAREEIERISQQ